MNCRNHGSRLRHDPINQVDVCSLCLGPVNSAGFGHTENHVSVTQLPVSTTQGMQALGACPNCHSTMPLNFYGECVGCKKQVGSVVQYKPTLAAAV